MRDLPSTFEVGERSFGGDRPPMMVAELSANHVGRLDVALRSVEAAAAAGADAIKLQTYTADSLTLDVGSEVFRIGGGTPWDGQSLYRLYEGAMMPMEWHEPLFQAAAQAGILAFSTPTDRATADFLRAFEPPMYKVASFEINDLEFIGHVASIGRPVVLSSGVAEETDLEAAVRTCREAGNDDIVLLKCTSAYPASAEDANLLTMRDMRERYRVLVGVSDHSEGWTVPVVAASLGAVMVEKHFILDRDLGGPDAAFSMEPAEFGRMADAVRRAHGALGSVTYELTPKAAANRRFMRSLFACSDIARGEEITRDKVRSLRPHDGLEPAELPDILGRRATRDLPMGTPLRPGDTE